MKPIRFGFPRMHKEAGERRDFLPETVKVLTDLGCDVVIERTLGAGMGLRDEDYLAVSPRVSVGSNEEAFEQDVVLTVRAPELDEYAKLRTGATLVSMLHFPTRPRRIRKLREAGLKAISLDSIVDDEGKRLVENMRAVAWNGVEAAFDALERTWAEFDDPSRRPVRVSVLGAGSVGKHAMEAATKYGNAEEAAERLRQGFRGAEATALGRNLTRFPDYMKDRLKQTDVLVDASQRSDPTRPLIPNEWLGWLPAHAVICDLVVDPYILEVEPPTVRSIEGIPHGDLDQYVFLADDAAWSTRVPDSIPSRERRAVASCYSWPGVHPRPCMVHYARQLEPLLQTLIAAGGSDALSPKGGFWERALYRGTLGIQPPL